MNTLGLWGPGFMLTLQETLSIHGSSNRPIIEFIAIFTFIYKNLDSLPGKTN